MGVLSCPAYFPMVPSGVGGRGGRCGWAPQPFCHERPVCVSAPTFLPCILAQNLVITCLSIYLPSKAVTFIYPIYNRMENIVYNIFIILICIYAHIYNHASTASATTAGKQFDAGDGRSHLWPLPDEGKEVVVRLWVGQWVAVSDFVKVAPSNRCWSEFTLCLSI